MNKTQQKAYQLISIATYILARTPMVLGYARHNTIIVKLVAMKHDIDNSIKATNDINNSKEWEKIQKILNI